MRRNSGEGRGDIRPSPLDRVALDVFEIFVRVRVTERVRVKMACRHGAVALRNGGVGGARGDRHVKVWVRGKIYYNGRLKNANKMARILPLYQGFVRDTAEFWGIHYHYSMRGANPGPLSPIYPLFRDRILLQALTEIRNEMAVKEGVDPADLPPLRYVMKRSPRVRDGQPTPRAICEWVESGK